MSHWDSYAAERSRAYEEVLIEVEGWLSNPDLSLFNEKERSEIACRIIRNTLLRHSDDYARQFVTSGSAATRKDSP